MIIIGCDPDLRKSGVCVLKDGEIIELMALSFVEFLELLSQRPVFYSGCKFAIEDVTKNKATFARGVNQAAMRKIAQNVGQVKAVAILMQECVKAYTGEEPILVPPGIGKQTKRDAKLFKQFTGWEGQTNQDKRDAWAIADYAYRKLK